MTPTQQADRPMPLVADAPALAKPGWIPKTEWKELEEIRETHLRLLRARAEAGHAVSEIERRHEAEDEERATALQEAARLGVEHDLAAPTPPEERKAELAPAEERLTAVADALDEFLREAETFVEDHVDDWFGDLDATDAEAMERWEEAKRVAEQAKAEVASRKKLRMWLGREAGRHPTFKNSTARHYPYDEMNDPPIETNVVTTEQLAGGITNV